MSQVSKPASDRPVREAPAAGQPCQAQPQAEETRTIPNVTGITIQFLRLVSETTGTSDLMRAVTTLFHQQSSYDAVRVRLHGGEDYSGLEKPSCPSR
jgi:hypothetical protein